MLGVAVGLCAVRQETVLFVGPKQRVEGCKPLGTACLDHRVPAALQRPLDESGQHLLERLPLQVVEQYVGAGRRQIAYLLQAGEGHLYLAVLSGASI